MAHFAELNENNEVVRVLVVNNSDIMIDGIESEQKGVEFLSEIFGGVWKQTSYNGNFRKNYAGYGMIYDEHLDAFMTKKPFQSWILNEDLAIWESPIQKPDDGKKYIWNEDTLSWVEVNV